MDTYWLKKFDLRDQVRAYAVFIVTGGDEQILEFLFHHKENRLRLGVDELLDEAYDFNDRDYVLICVAINLWCDSGPTKLSDLEDLDNENFLKVLSALTYKREMIEVWEALEYCHDSSLC